MGAGELRIGGPVPHAELQAFAAWSGHGCRKASTHVGYVKCLREFFTATATRRSSRGSGSASGRQYASLRRGSTLLEAAEQLGFAGGSTMDRNGFMLASLKKLLVFLEQQQRMPSASASAASASAASAISGASGGGVTAGNPSAAPTAHRYTRRAALLLPNDTLKLDDGEVSIDAVKQLKELGSGAFGRVCECSIGGKRKGLAMKLVKTTDADAIREVEEEFRVMDITRGLSRFVMHGRGGGRTVSKNDELSIINEEFCIKPRDFVSKLMSFAGRPPFRHLHGLHAWGYPTGSHPPGTSRRG